MFTVTTSYPFRIDRVRYRDAGSAVRAVLAKRDAGRSSSVTAATDDERAELRTLVCSMARHDAGCVQLFKEIDQ